jgi:multidrug efflux system membrane fusion protein
MSSSRSRNIGRLAALLAVGACAALLAGCEVPGSVAETAAKKAKGGEAVPVLVAPVEVRSVPLQIQAIGNVESAATVAVKSRVDGQIMEAPIRDGQDVRRGQVLFQLDPRPFETQLRQAEATLARDRAQLEHALAQDKRYQELLARNFVSKDAYAQYQTNAEIARATVRASEAAVANAKLQLDYTTIRAPIDGRAGKVLISLGNMVKANDTAAMVTINQISPIYVSFAVPEQDLGAIRAAMAKHTLKVEAVPSDAGAKATEGELSFFDNTVDSTTGTVRVRAAFPNRDRVLWPGQFATATLVLGEQHDAIVVPSQAVQTGPKGQYVFLVTPDLRAKVRPVQVARIDGPISVIGKGLAAGDKVVTTGQLRLVDGTKVKLPETRGKS